MSRRGADLDKIASPIELAFSSAAVTPQSLLWPNSEDLGHRFARFLSQIPWESHVSAPARILDVGCGAGFLLDYLHHTGRLEQVEYFGIDISATILAAARQRWPGRKFELLDVRERPFAESQFDYVIMCGIFTARFDLARSDMVRLLEETVRSAWPSASRWLAFNCMSIHVDWEREDLFHYPLDEAVHFAKANLSRHVMLCHDYGLYEYTCFVRCEPVRNLLGIPTAWNAGPQSME